MAYYEIEFKAQHDCPYNDLSRQMPGLVFAEWCNHKRDVIEISCEDEDLTSFEDLHENLRILEQSLHVKILRKSFGKNQGQLVTEACHCAKMKKSISPVIEKHNCLRIQPIFYKQGWEWYRVLAFSQDDIKKLFQELERFCEVQMVSRHTIEDTSVRESFMVSTCSLLGELTKRQSFALLTALSRGYYQIPKKISTDELAKSLGLPRTTFAEHLRKAESKVLRAVTPLLELGASAARAQTIGKERTEEVFPSIRA